MTKLQFLVFLGILVRFLFLCLAVFVAPFKIALQNVEEHSSTITTFLIMLGMDIVSLVLMGFLIVKIHIEERSIILLIILCLFFIFDIIRTAIIIGEAFNLGYTAVLSDFLRWHNKILDAIITTIKKIHTSIVQFIH